MHSEAYPGWCIFVAKQTEKGQKLESSLSLVETEQHEKKKEKAFTIDDEVESLKQSFTVIHLWQKMWAIILDVRSKPKYQVCMHCMCAEYTNWSASAQIQFTEPYSSGWLQNNTNSSSFFAFFVEAKAQRISIFFKSKERITFSNSFSRMQITFYQDGVT